QVQLPSGAVSAPLIIGADGLHSQLRGALCGPSAPFFTGQVAWRATIAATGGPDRVQVFMGAGRHLVSYPLRGGMLRNIVAVQERSAWTRESWSAPADLPRFAAAFSDFAPVVRGWINAVQTAGEWGLFRHPIAPVWGRVLPKGAAYILGDAAHPTLPFLAQGASMALEDGAVLADLLDSDTPDRALARYQALRAPRVARIIAAANANARNYHLAGARKTIAHMGLRTVDALAPNVMLRRFDWLYGYDATQVVNAQP
ncbi:MAG: FAD-dependent monooxygenase, partial [Cypionkella sp.]